MVSKVLPNDHVQAMKRALELAGIVLQEGGSPSDPEGHVLSARARNKLTGEDREVFWAMINSNRRDYLVRHVPDLFR